jgi:hypothetical protein
VGVLKLGKHPEHLSIIRPAPLPVSNGSVAEGRVMPSLSSSSAIPANWRTLRLRRVDA